MKRLLIVADHSLRGPAASASPCARPPASRSSGSSTAACSIADALEPRSTPDVVLVDDMQEPEHALARLREVATPAAGGQERCCSRCAWTTSGSRRRSRPARDAVISKTVHPVALGTLLREISQGNVVHRYQSARGGGAGGASARSPQRELEILRLVAEGQTNGRIARELWVTEQTVKFHLSNTYRKLGVANRTEASRYAYMHDLVAPA